MTAVGEILLRYYPALLAGTWVTAQLCLLTWAVGMPVGVCAGIAAFRWDQTIGRLSKAVAFILSATPVLILLYWLYYPAAEFTGARVSAFSTAVLVFSLYTTSAVAETVREALVGFPRHFISAGQVCGLTSWQIAWHIRTPLLARQLVPAFLFTMLSTLHMSLFASLISVPEVFRVAQTINASEYRAVPVFTVVAVMFMMVCLPLHGVALILRRRYARDLSER